MQPEDTRNEKTTDKILSSLKSLQLSNKELEPAARYLGGEAGEEVLSEIAFRDMTQMSQNQYIPMRRLFEACFREKRYEEASRILRLLYAVGSYTCCECFVYIQTFRQAVERGDLQVDRGMALAIAAQQQYRHSLRFCAEYTSGHFMVTSQLLSLADFANRDPATVKRALQDFDKRQVGGNILLYTLYFYLSYNEEALDREKQTKADAQETGFVPFKILPRDEELLREYEELLTGLLGRIFEPDASEDQEICSIRQSLGEGRLQEGQLQKVRERNIEKATFMMVAGFAFVNYMLSARLRDIMRVCGAAAPNRLLDTIENMDPRGELARIGDRLEELFGISGHSAMLWATAALNRRQDTGMEKNTLQNEILPALLRKYPDIYFQAYEKASFSPGSMLAEIIKSEDPDMYRRVILNQGRDMREKIIMLITGRISCVREAREYLEGKADLASLYPLRPQLGNWYGGYNEREALEQYDKTYHDEDFYSRCMGFMALSRKRHFFEATLFDNDTINLERLEHSFRGMDHAGIEPEEQLEILVQMADEIYVETRKYDVAHGCVPIFQQYLARRPGEMENIFAGAGAYGRYFALLVYGSQAKSQVTEDAQACGEALAQFAKGKDAWQEQILSYSQDGSKLVKQELEKQLAERPGWRDRVTGLLSSKKAAERELGIRVLAKWNTPLDQEALKALYEREKNAKIRTLLDTVLGDAPDDAALSKEELVKNLHKGGRKRSLAWAYETPFSPVHTKKGGQATQEYLQALLLCYCSMIKPGVSKDAALLAQELEPQELALYVGELFDKWMEAGAEAKKRWVLYAASIHGGPHMVKRLYHQIQEWPREARGAIAAEAVQALALSPQPQALLIVDGISRKFKFKQVKTAAGQALEFAAGQLGLTREQLEDRIVPDLGFDNHMERRFDYGSRSFTVTVTPALEVEVRDENGKKLKNMPAPGARDDGEKAALAYGEFKELKKQMKATVSSQKQRLEAALSAERLWTIQDWQELFVRNPIMHQFAMGLIWGIYEGHSLVRSFRYMEDGSFNTEEEEEYTLPQQGQIGLVHPLELSEEGLKAWKQQLEDYEITQPIVQLDREVYRLTQKEQESKSLERFGGIIVNDLSLGGRLAALGWYRGSVQERGGFYTYYREDAALGLGVELHFSGSYVGGGSIGGEDVTVYDARFYRAGTIERGSYCYDEAEGEKALALKDISPRYFSEIVWQLAKATANAGGRNEDWKAERR